MLDNPFENYERIIHAELLNKAETFPCPPEDYYVEITELFAADVVCIFNKINSLKVENSTRKDAKWIAQAYQEKIDNLMGTMGIIMEEPAFSINDYVISGSWCALAKEIIETLREIMNLLILRHPDLLDLELEMCPLMETNFVKQTSQKLNDELLRLPEGSARHEAFKLLLLPIEEPVSCYYYTHIFYFDILIKEVININRVETADEEQAGQIRELLWKFNFNHPRYLSILQKEYEEQLGDSQGKERVKKCMEIRKKIRLNRPYSRTHLYFMELSLDQQSEVWLNTELNCTRALIAAEAIIAVNPYAEFTVKTRLSLRQLAGLLRLFSEKGILLTEDRRKLIQFFATYFVPVSGKRFSPAALTRSYDQQKGDAILKQVEGLLK